MKTFTLRPVTPLRYTASYTTVLRHLIVSTFVLLVGGSPTLGGVCELLCVEPATTAPETHCHTAPDKANAMTAAAHCDHVEAAIDAIVPLRTVPPTSADALSVRLVRSHLTGGHVPSAVGFATAGPPGTHSAGTAVPVVLRI